LADPAGQNDSTHEPRPSPDTGERGSDIIGSTLGGCTIISKLGEGGMGAVFKAHDPGLDRMVAIKVLPPALARDEAHRERFLREARALARVKHHNLVQVYSVAVENGLHFISMEYIEGESLQQRIRSSGPMVIEQMLALGGQVLSALHAVHAQGITHRDIKSSNIMIDTEGRAVLMDLGLAKDEESSGVTTAGVIIGTPEFMSPEQAMGELATPLSDIYSFGIVTYEMATGRVPFRGKSTVAVLRLQCEAQPASLREARPDLPAEYVEAVSRAMKKDPRERPQSAADLAELMSRSGTTPELKALALSPVTARNILHPAPAVALGAEADLRSAPTIVGAGRQLSSRPTREDRTEAILKRHSFYKRPYLFVVAAVIIVIAAGLLRARQLTGNRRTQAEPILEVGEPYVTVYVGGENLYPGHKARLIGVDPQKQTLQVVLDDGTEKAIALASHPEIRYDDESAEDVPAQP
jgi:predicted Ser/Thr protein kinase